MVLQIDIFNKKGRNGSLNIRLYRNQEEIEIIVK